MLTASFEKMRLAALRTEPVGFGPDSLTRWKDGGGPTAA
jgi:hypothetical protein